MTRDEGKLASTCRAATTVKKCVPYETLTLICRFQTVEYIAGITI